MVNGEEINYSDSLFLGFIFFVASLCGGFWISLIFMVFIQLLNENTLIFILFILFLILLLLQMLQIMIRQTLQDLLHTRLDKRYNISLLLIAYIIQTKVKISPQNVTTSSSYLEILFLANIIWTNITSTNVTISPPYWVVERLVVQQESHLSS